MGETGKRNRNQRDNDNEGSNQKKRFSKNDKSTPSKRYENSGDGELVVYRMLCPNDTIGSVIGKGGKVINSLRQDTQAKIKIVDPFPGADYRVITIYCYVKEKDAVDVDEDAREPLCAAQDALLKVHDTIASAKDYQGDSDKKNKEEARMLVPGSQAANIIGKAGATIKRLRAKTSAGIKVDPKDSSNPTHSCAMSFDNFVVISGDAQAVKKALFAVSAIMYKFSPREEISLDTTIPEIPSSIIIPSDLPIYPAGSFYPNAEAAVSQARSVPPVIGATSQVTDLLGYGDLVGAWPALPSSLPIVPGHGAPVRSEELVVRVLCPSDKIGRVIGKGGSSIKNVRQATGAQIDVDDTKKGSKECIITVTTRESTDDVKSAAVEAVLLLQEKINDGDEEKVNIGLLVPSRVIGCLIGKGGSIVNEMRKNTQAVIHISKGEKPKCASPDEEFVEVLGEVGHLRDALLQIVIRLRDGVLKDRDSDRNAPPAEHAYSSGISVPSALHSVPPGASLGYDQRVEAGSALGMLTGGNLYGYGSLQGGDSAYGSLSSYSSQPYGGLPPYEMVIPANAVNKVLGKGGANMANIRQISGATIEIAESKSSRSERIAQISGTQDQKRTAENLIHAFIMSA